MRKNPRGLHELRLREQLRRARLRPRQPPAGGERGGAAEQELVPPGGRGGNRTNTNTPGLEAEK